MGDLRARIAERVRREGPVTFAAYMDMALYDLEDGFYARPPVGSRGAFVTSPHVSAAFGDLLAAQLRGCWERLGRPDPFDVVEAGAGDGTLASRILATIGTQIPIRYRAVERSAGAREALERRGIPTEDSLASIGPVTGCVIANELLDNLAFHRVRAGANGPVEVCVGLDGDRLVEVDGEPTVQTGPLAPDEERIVRPAAAAFVRDAIGLPVRGYVVLFDYGPSAARAFQAHRLHDRLLDEPGAADITAGVDFDELAAAGRAAGATVWGPRSQRAVLLGLGYQEWMARLRHARLAAEADGRSREALALIAERSRAPLLVDEAHLGGLLAIAFGAGVDAPPPGFDVPEPRVG